MWLGCQKFKQYLHIFQIRVNKANRSDLIGITGLMIFLKLDWNRWFLVCPSNLMDNMAPLPCYGKLCALFLSHQWIQTGFAVQKRPMWQLFVLCDLEIWWITLKNNRAPLLWHCKLCASFCSNVWIQRELQSGNIQIGAKFVLTTVNLTFDLNWPWPFAWTSFPPMVITHEILTMEYSEKGVTDRLNRS